MKNTWKVELVVEDHSDDGGEDLFTQEELPTVIKEVLSNEYLILTSITVTPVNKSS